MRSTTTPLIPLLTTLLLVPLVQPSRAADETKTLWVAHRRVDCVGVARQKCYLIKESQYEDWRFWYGEIEGFDFEEGYAYEIRVRQRTVDDPPADASSIELELVEVLLKVETFETPAMPIPATPPNDEAPAPPPTESIADSRVDEIEESTLPTPPAEITTEIPAEPQRPAESRPPTPPRSSEPAARQIPPPPTPPAAVSESTEADRPGELLRGHLTIGAGIEARSFKPCGADESLWVEDRSGSDLWELYRRLAGWANRPVFMEVTGLIEEAPTKGFGAHFPQQIVVQEVRNASVESAGCFAEPPRYAFRASGNEPFWNLEISRGGLVFSELGQEQRLRFPYSPPTFFAEQIIYRSQIRGQQPRALVVRLVEEPCSDTMADARFSFSATLQIDGRDLRGCARQGDDEP